MLAINADESQRKRAMIKERLKDERRNGKILNNRKLNVEKERGERKCKKGKE